MTNLILSKVVDVQITEISEPHDPADPPQLEPECTKEKHKSTRCKFVCDSSLI